MFKKRFIVLCNKKGVPPTVACKAIGLSSATFSKWDDNSIPRQATLQKFADYFGCTVDELLAEDYNDRKEVSITQNNVNGDNTATVTRGGELNEFELELISIFRELDTKRKNALLTKAYELKGE